MLGKQWLYAICACVLTVTSAEAGTYRPALATKDIRSPFTVQSPAALPSGEIRFGDLRQALGSLRAHGLSPQHYIRTLDQMEHAGSAALNQFVMELLADLSYGATRSDIESGYVNMAGLLERFRRCENYVACMQRMAARHPQYEPMQIVFDQYRQVAAAGGWPSVPSGKTLYPGDADMRIEAVRARLQASGDYRIRAGAIHNAVYDQTLEAAVRAFQARHQLKVDGEIGPATLAALNVPAAKRMEQLKLSLERLRRLPHSGQHPHVRVNIPSFKLTAYDGTRTALAMDVIVGQRSRQTPEFDNAIDRVVLNPTWTPTQRILRKDLLPKFRNDPDYARRGGYKIKDRVTGESLDPWAVNWETVSARDVRVVQRSGRGNALGKVKFLLPDNQSIYLHDTSKPYLFEKNMRALSSGCIRLSDPKAFLDFVIKAQPDSSFAHLREAYDRSSRKHVQLDQPVPVYTTYFTAWVNAQGQVEFYDDIYRKDDRLQLALEKETRSLASR